MSGCAVAYYLPGQTLVGQVPKPDECEKGIFREIIETCGTDLPFNTGSINVEDMPRFSGALVERRSA